MGSDAVGLQGLEADRSVLTGGNRIFGALSSSFGCEDLRDVFSAVEEGKALK